MSQAQVAIGEKLGSFRIESVIGSGAMGVVYRGIKEDTGRVVAVKVVGAEFAQGGKIRDRFEREAEILKQFRHPGIVRFFAMGRFRGTSYIAMEFVPGVTLEKVVLERGNLPWREVVELGIQICEALQYAHEHGVVHRDLKPSNLMVSADGKIKLTDFGIAKDLDATALTATGRTLGTAAYMAPEQIKGTPPVSHKTDLYALGVVLYQMLAGKPPFEGNSPVVLMHSHLNEPPPRPSAKVHEIPKALDELVVNLMAKVPGDRPWDAAAVGAKLTELRDKAASGAPVAMVWPASGKSTAKSAGPASAGGDTPSSSLAADRPRKKARKTGSLSRLTGRDGSPADSRFFGLSRSTIDTSVLVLALLAIGGFITYWVWPPSAKYLYEQAATLMASSRRADWLTARDEYIKPLQARFPTNPYKEQLRAWLDKILLDDAENRVKVITSGLQISMAEPANNTERKVVVQHQLATGASRRRDDQTAIVQWKELANEINPDDPDERQWYLLALARIERLENDIKDRRQYVQKQLELAEAALRAGRPNEAIEIRANLADQYRGYTDLADLPDLFPPAPTPPGSEPKTGAQAPAPPAAAPESDARGAPNTAPPTPPENPGAKSAPDEKPSSPPNAPDPDKPAPEF
jgi:serine/threonine-protein kinase